MALIEKELHEEKREDYHCLEASTERRSTKQGNSSTLKKIEGKKRKGTS